VTLSFGTQWSGSDVSQTDATESINGSTRIPGSPSDALIDHNYDQIVILLDPIINVQLFPDRVRWAPDFSRTTPLVLRVGWLNGSQTMPSGVAETLNEHGILSDEFPQILLADPFANDPSGKQRLDPGRFVLKTALPYVPTGDTYTFGVDNNYSQTEKNSSSLSYSVGASVSGEIIGNKLKVSNTYTWTNASSQSNSSSSANSSTVSVAMPSANYAGPSDIYVYVDTVYKTFVLSFLNPSGQSTSVFRSSFLKGQSPQ
jgi:hypothetical protein